MSITNIFLFTHILAAGLQLLLFHCSYGQDTIYLRNPSFEDLPRMGTISGPPIKGWHDCASSMFPEESPPDIHPVHNAAWGITLKAVDGETYLGLVTRYNGSYESVSQLLNSSLVPGKCYSFSGYLNQSDIYQSDTRRTMNTKKLENFIEPAELLIWGGTVFCEKEELLAKSGGVINHEWKLYEFTLSPKIQISSITIEAFYEWPATTPTNGHILVDGLSPIIEIDCK